MTAVVMSRMERIDHHLNKAENKLTSISRYPVIGTIPGAVKILLGISQMIAGLAAALFFALRERGSEYLVTKYAFTQVKHGAGNVVAGIFETIPVIQTVLYYVREARRNRLSDAELYVHTCHERKFMPYETLVSRDVRIEGADVQDVSRANDYLAQYIREEIARTGILAHALSTEIRLQLMQNAIDTR